MVTIPPFPFPTFSHCGDSSTAAKSAKSAAATAAATAADAGVWQGKTQPLSPLHHHLLLPMVFADLDLHLLLLWLLGCRSTILT